MPALADDQFTAADGGEDFAPVARDADCVTIGAGGLGDGRLPGHKTIVGTVACGREITVGIVCSWASSGASEIGASGSGEVWAAAAGRRGSAAMANRATLRRLPPLKRKKSCHGKPCLMKRRIKKAGVKRGYAPNPFDLVNMAASSGQRLSNQRAGRRVA